MHTLAHATRRSFLAVAVVAIVLSLGSRPVLAQRTETSGITIFAAASLKNALDGAAGGYQKASGGNTVISYAASSALAKQIEQGAPADIFVSADLDWMDYLAKGGLIKSETRSNLLGNRLVLIAPASSTIALEIKKDFALAAALGEGRLAMADVKAVPAGKYGKAALEKLGVWGAVEAKTAQAENVRAALALVARNEAPLGIVYQTDAAAEPAVKIIATFPEDTHAPIIYPIAVTRDAKNPEAAAAFIAYLKTPEGQDVFIKQGFTILK